MAAIANGHDPVARVVASGTAATPSAGPEPAPATSSRPVVAHRVFLALLHSPLGRRLDGFCELRFLGRASGRPIALPVQCAREDARLVIYVGQAADKHWWRNFRQGHSVHVRVGGNGYAAHGRVIDADDPERAWAERTYKRRFPKVDVARADPMLIIDADPLKAR